MPIDLSVTVLADLTIQQVARRTGLSESALRYYERIGLLDPVPRDPSSGHRRYPPAPTRRPASSGCSPPRCGRPANAVTTMPNNA